MKTKEQRVLLLWSTWTCMLFDLSHSEEKPNELKVRPANLGSCRQSGGLPEVLRLNILMFTLLACHFLCQNDVLGLTAGHFMPDMAMAMFRPAGAVIIGRHVKALIKT